MTRPIFEPSIERELARQNFTDEQLLRRPAPDDPGKFVGLIFSSEDALVVGNDANGWFLGIPSDLDGYALTHAHAYVYTVSSSGLVTVMIRNVVQAVDMLSTAITIDANERSSYTAATPPVISTSNRFVSTGDIVVADLDTIGTGSEGLVVILHFESVT